MIEVKSREAAIEWAGRCPASDNEVIEVRSRQAKPGKGGRTVGNLS